MKVNVGITKKVPGPQAYSSIGASCQIEVDLEDVLLDDKEALRNTLRGLYRRADASVQEQLSQPARANGRDRNGAEDSRNGQCRSDSNRNGRHDNGDRPATDRQINFLFGLVKRRKDMDRRDLGKLVMERYQVAALDRLSTRQASELIDELRAD